MIKQITLEDLLKYTYSCVYTQILEMSNLVNTSDELDEGYIMELQKRIPLLAHTIQNCIVYKDKLCSKGDDNNVTIKN